MLLPTPSSTAPTPFSPFPLFLAILLLSLFPALLAGDGGGRGVSPVRYPWASDSPSSSSSGFNGSLAGGEWTGNPVNYTVGGVLSGGDGIKAHFVKVLKVSRREPNSISRARGPEGIHKAAASLHWRECPITPSSSSCFGGHHLMNAGGGGKGGEGETNLIT